MFSNHISKLIYHQDLILERLNESKERAFNDKIFQEALCRCIKNLCQCENTSIKFKKGLLELSLELLLDKRTHIAAYMIKDDIRKLINHYSVETTIKMAKTMCQSDDFEAVIGYVVAIYNNLSMEKFIRRQLPILLSTIVCQVPVTNVKPILEFIAKILKTKVKKMLFEHFNRIYPEVVTKVTNTEQYIQCTKFLEIESENSIKDMVSANRTDIITQLLLKFNPHYKRVTTAFNFLAKHDDEFKCEVNGKLSKEDMAKYIEPRFHGVLDYFHRTLKEKFTGIDVKSNLLASLSDIIRLMGPEKIASVKHKLMTTLNNVLRANCVPLQFLIKAWEAFISTVDIKALSPILGQVIANLLQLYYMTDTDKKPIMKMFRYMILDHKDDIKDAFEILNFIPEDSESPDLIELNDFIRKENGITENTDIKNILKLFSKSLMNENNDVRKYTLEKLFIILEQNQEQIQVLITSNEETDPIVSQLIKKLLNCAQCSDKNVVILAGACLGKIGAVDPGRLNIVENLKSCSQNTYLSVQDEEFAIELINILVQAYLRVSDSKEGDACSFSIQEVLKAYKISSTAKMTSISGRIWNRLSDSTKELLRPLLGMI